MKKLIYISLGLILLLACFLRFKNITTKGIFLTDEGNYLQESQFVVSGIKSIFVKKNLDKIRHETEGVALRHGKPTHTLLISSLALLQGGVKAYSGCLVSAIFGILSIILLFIIAKELFNENIALISALFLAISSYHTMYSREGLAEIDSIFFFLLSFYFYLKSCQDSSKNKLLSLAISGFLTGLAYTCNYRLFLIPLFLWIYEINYFIFRKSIFTKDTLNRIFILNICMLLPILLFELPYHLALLIFRRNNAILPFSTYLEQLFEHLFFYSGKSTLNFKDILTYPYLIWHLEGPIIFTLLTLGIILMFRRISLSKFYLAIQFVVPFIFFSLFEENNARHLAVSLPAMALISGYAFYYLKSILKKNMDKVLLILILFIGIYKCYPLLHLKSGFGEAYNFLGNKDNKKHISTHWWVSTFFVKHDSVADFRNIKDEEDLKEVYQQGFRYLLVDIMKYFGNPWPNWLGDKSRVLIDIELKCKPVFTAFDNRGTHLQIWFEHNINFKRTKRYFINTPEEEKKYLKIYDLKDYFTLKNDKG